MPILLIAFIVAATAWTALSLYLSARQAACVRQHRDAVPPAFAGSVTIEEHRKTADYTLARERLPTVHAVFDLAISLTWVLGGTNLVYGALASVLPPSLGLGVAFLIATFAAGSLLKLPLDVYETFVLEQRFGFNPRTVNAIPVR